MSGLVVGAVIGFISAFLLRSWQYRRDLWLKRIDVLCTAIDNAAQVATEYWLKDSASDATPNDARILGLQMRVDGMFSSLGFDNISDAKLIEGLNNFRDCLTGGDFEGITRKADPDRARLTQMFASDLIVEVWTAAYAHLSFSGWWGRRRAQYATCKVWLAANPPRSILQRFIGAR